MAEPRPLSSPSRGPGSQALQGLPPAPHPGPDCPGPQSLCTHRAENTPVLLQHPVEKWAGGVRLLVLSSSEGRCPRAEKVRVWRCLRTRAGLGACRWAGGSKEGGESPRRGQSVPRGN